MIKADRLAGLLALVWLALAPQAGAQGIGGLAGGSDAAQAAEEARRAAEAEAAAAPVTTQPASRPAFFVLRRVETGPSGLLPAAELDTVARRWEGRRVTRASLSDLLGEVQALYDARGLGLAQPVLAAVNPASGIVRIDLIEPRVGRIRSLDPTVSDAYLAYRLRLAAGRPLDTGTLAARLDRLSLGDDMLIETVLEPGTGPGEVDLSIGLSGAPARGGSVIFDNNGRSTTGKERLTFAYGWRSLTGWNDPLVGSVTVFEGGGTAALSYARVVHPDGARVVVALDYGKTRTLTAPVVENRTWGFEGGLSLPLILESRRRLGAGLSVLQFGETGSTAGVPTLSQAGRGLRLSFSGQWQGDDWVMSASTSVTAVDWEDRLAGTSQGFSALGLSFAAARRIEPVVLSIQASAQIADGTAPARLRFSAAGPGAVRGYDDTGGSDDSGYFARLQIEAADPFRFGNGFSARPYAFVDGGRLYARVGGAHVAGFAPASVGVGATVGLGRRASLDVFLAHQLTAVPGTGRRETVLMVTAPFRF